MIGDVSSSDERSASRKKRNYFSKRNIRRSIYTREDFRGPGGGESGEKEGERVGKRAAG